MNADSSLDALFRAARSEAAGDGARLDRAEFAFETRLMSRLREDRSESLFAWAWRLTPFFAALVIAVGIWNHATTAHLNTTATVVANAVRENPQRFLLSLVSDDRWRPYE